jgi:hypothetical protein
MEHPTCTEDVLPYTLASALFLNFLYCMCKIRHTDAMQAFFLTPGCEHVCNTRGMILISATLVSIDLNIHHATRAFSVLGTSGMPNLPKAC